MPAFLRVATDDQGHARFSDWDPAVRPEHPEPHELGASTPLPASAAVVICAPAGGGHPQQPEARRQLAVMLSGTCTITATGETRSFGPGDVLLVEDTTGSGHSSTTSDGSTALLASLE
jgi:quercetin dioxygenase-like cupin family protein